MSKRRFILFLLVAVAFLVATGIPTKSQNSGQRIIAGRNVNMVSGTQLPHGDPWLQRQNEPSIAVSTRNPLHLLAGANDYRTIDMPGKPGDELPGEEEKRAQALEREPWLGVFKSYDGGQSWISTLLPGFHQDFTPEGLDSPLKQLGYPAAADPVVRAGTNGLFYYSGIAFDRTTKEGVVFVARFIDNNNLEKGDCIEYLDTKVIASGGGGLFLDKSWIAVGLPHGKGQKVKICKKWFTRRSRRGKWRRVAIDEQRIARHNVYIAFSAFTGEGETLQSQIFFARSTDCGENWSEPIALSKGHTLNQGAIIAVDPRANGHVSVAWRRFNKNNQSNAIIVARSVNGCRRFHKVVEVASFEPFDQGSSVVTFRTNSYPTLTIDNSGRIYLAWSQRIGNPPSRDARIVLSTSKNGLHWSSPTPVEEEGTLGHQLMPSLTFAAGKLMMVWYDQRNDISGRFTEYIDDWAGETRHTLDIRVAQAEPDKNPVFEPSRQVSRYLWALTEDGQAIYQVQFNPVNYPLFKTGTWPFMGDYVDIAPSPMFVLDNSGHWRYNTETSGRTVFHVAWTDNRDVRAPPDGNWELYNPPFSQQEDPNFQTSNSCLDWERAGMRNQNIYTSRITSGIVAGSPGNTKPLGTLGETPDGERIPRAFVVFVKNTTDQIKSFRLTIANQPPDGIASFLEFDLLYELDVEIAPHSSASRSVFVDSPNPKATVRVNIVEIDAPYGELVPDGLDSYVVLNPEIENPEIENPEIENPEIENEILMYEYHNPEIENPEIINWDYSVLNPEIINPEIENPEIINPEIINPEIENPEIINPEIENANVLNPEIENPSIDDPTAGQITDVICSVFNRGNTTSTYVFRTLSEAAEEDGTLPGGIQAQLLIYRVYKTPAEYGSPSDSCALREQQHHQLILNIINPEIENPEIENTDLENPEIENPEIENATFSLEPDGEALVILRLWNPYQSSAQTLSSPRTLNATKNWDFQSIIQSLIGYQQTTARNTKELQDGDDSYPSDSSIFMITTKSLDDGEVDQLYRDFLNATGGKKPYTWSVISGNLPDGLNLILNSVTKKWEIYGTPTTAGTSAFTVQVEDAEGQIRTRAFSITISPAGGGKALTITSPSTLPGGVAAIPYSTTLTAVSGTGSLQWSLAGGSLPAELTLFSNGVISGTPAYAGTFTFTIQVEDLSVPSQIASQNFSLLIAPHTVSMPNPPIGTATGGIGISYTFTTGGSSCDQGHDIEYRFDWGGGNYSSWASTTSVSHYWTGTGTYLVKAQARCKDYPVIESAWSSEKTVTIYTAVSTIQGTVTYNGMAVTNYTNEQATFWALDENTGKEFPISPQYNSTNGTYSIPNIPPGIYGIQVSIDNAEPFNGKKFPGDYDGWITPIQVNAGDPVVNQDLSCQKTIHLTTPINNLNEQPWPYPYYDTHQSPLLFTWESIAEASTYKVVVDKYQSSPYSYISTLVDIAGITDTQKTLSLPLSSANEHYEFRIYAYNASSIMVGKLMTVYVSGYGLDYRFRIGAIQDWASSYDGPGNFHDRPYGIAVAPSGNVYVAAASPNSETGYDYVVVKYDISGTKKWTKKWADSGESTDAPYGGIAIDSAENVYVTGFTRPGNTNNMFHAEFVTIKYDKDGNKKWIAKYNSGYGFNVPQAIAVHETGRNVYVYVTGYSWKDGTNWDYTTVKYDGNGDFSASEYGNEEWVARYDSSEGKNDQATAIAVDEQGGNIYVYVTGFSRKVSTYRDFATVKYQDNGTTVTEVWNNRYDSGEGNQDNAQAITVDSATGDVFVTGYSYRSATDYDYVTIKYRSSDGYQLWLKDYDNAGGDDSALAIAFDPAGYVCVTGCSHNGTNFDYATIKYRASDGYEFWKWIPGNIDGVLRYNGPGNGNDIARKIALDSSGNVWVTGKSYGGTSTDFDCTTIKYRSFDAMEKAIRYDGPGNGEDESRAIAVDLTSDNVYVTGESIGTAGNSDIAIIMYDSGVTEKWAKRYEGPGMKHDSVIAMTKDSSGNIYVAGQSIGSGYRRGPGYDITIGKYAPNGSEIWVRRYEALGSENFKWNSFPAAIAVDSSGVYVTGYTLESNLTGENYLTVKYSHTGSFEWAVMYNGPGNGDDKAKAIAVDSSGVYVTGACAGSGTGIDYATVKYDINGSEIWVKSYDGPGSDVDSAHAIAVDSSGVYVTGQSFGSGTGFDYATIKYDKSTGAELWSSPARYDGGPGDYATALTLDSSGNVYVTGQSVGSGTSFDFATVKYDSSGTQQWASRYDGANYIDMANAIAVDASGNVYVTGRSDVTGGPTPYSDFATVKYNNLGNQEWAVRYDGPQKEQDEAYDLVLDPSGNVYVTGTSDGVGTSFDLATIKYDSSGVQKWVARYHGPGNFNDEGRAIALEDDQYGNFYVYVAGYSYGSGTGKDFVLIKYRQD